MKKSTKPTRANKFEKNRKVARIITLIISVTLILMLVIFGAWLFGGNNTASNESMKELSSSISMTTSSTESSETDSQSSNSSESSSSEEEETEGVETEETTPSDDNVLSAVTGDWKPIGTQQEGEHATNYDTGSQDRDEIKQAAAYATGLDASDMIEWRIENNGDQKVLATVSDSNQTETYRIYLEWVDNQGWQPTKVEQLKVNDKN